MITLDEFFEAPRSWSLLKYKILDRYLSQYFPKVNQRYASGAIAADLFAGRGRFDDGTEGSPVIIAKHAKKYKDRLGYPNQVILAEADPEDRRQLHENLKAFVDEKIVEIIPGDALDVGQRILEAIKPGVPLFVFLDPFGLKGLSMKLLLQIFERARKDSTELLINFNHRAIPRLAGICRNAASGDARMQRQAHATMRTVSDAFGGDWWLAIIRDGSISEESKPLLILRRYIGQYRSHFRWLGALPVTAGMPDESVKYYLIFASRSQIAFELMNDVMKKARYEFMLDALRTQAKGTLFEGVSQAELVPHRFQTDLNSLASRVYEESQIIAGAQAAYVGNVYNVVMRRPQLRSRLIARLFARYSCSEYNEAVKLLLQQGKLFAEDGRTRISDSADIKIVG